MLNAIINSDIRPMKQLSKQLLDLFYIETPSKSTLNLIQKNFKPISRK